MPNKKRKIWAWIAGSTAATGAIFAGAEVGTRFHDTHLQKQKHDEAREARQKLRLEIIAYLEKHADDFAAAMPKPPERPKKPPEDPKKKFGPFADADIMQFAADFDVRPPRLLDLEGQVNAAKKLLQQSAENDSPKESLDAAVILLEIAIFLDGQNALEKEKRAQHVRMLDGFATRISDLEDMRIDMLQQQKSAPRGLVGRLMR